MGTNNLMFEVFFRFLPDLISRLPLSSELTVDSWCFKMKLYFISYLLFISNLFQEMSTIAILKQVWYALVLLCCVNVLGWRCLETKWATEGFTTQLRLWYLV